MLISEDTSFESLKLKDIAKVVSTVPKGIKFLRKAEKILKDRNKMVFETNAIDWGMGETLAYGTLLTEGYDVRISGQDVERGTFSHRHAILRDEISEERINLLNTLSAEQGKMYIYNSLLSEYGVLGFDYGYAMANPNTLTIWEAQFGDFANGAQVVIDQFISSGEAKWLRMNGLVLLLPHGYEGQGPEHSSARLERYLQLCAEDNMQVVNCTTPANYFHVLRRQVRRNFRKPLVVMTPKSLLRHKAAVSDLAEMGPGTSFHRLLDEKGTKVKHGKAKRIVICSGKVYYDLLDASEKESRDDVYLLRVEQLYPFPIKSIGAELKKYPNAEIVWCQEEPKNQGAWSFIEPNIEWVMERIKAKVTRPRYVGRPAAASPATGLAKLHKEQQAALINDALTLEGK